MLKSVQVTQYIFHTHGSIVLTCSTSRQLKKAACLTVLASNGIEALAALKLAHKPTQPGVVPYQFDVILMGLCGV